MWDCDPPDPAFSGFHYFLYNYDENGNPLPAGSQTLTFRGVSAGPGYQFSSVPSNPNTSESTVIPGLELLVRAPGPQQTPFFMQILASKSYADPDAPVTLPAGYTELGVARFAFTLTNFDTIGQITDNSDSPELDYAGPPDGSGGKLRGVEHLRVFTQTLPGHDNDVIRGTFTTVVPESFVPSVFFLPGYLSFSNNDISMGTRVSPAAAAATPEPATLAAVGMAGLLMLRRTGR